MGILDVVTQNPYMLLGRRGSRQISHRIFIFTSGLINRLHQAALPTIGDIQSFDDHFLVFGGHRIDILVLPVESAFPTRECIDKNLFPVSVVDIDTWYPAASVPKPTDEYQRYE